MSSNSILDHVLNKQFGGTELKKIQSRQLPEERQLPSRLKSLLETQSKPLVSSKALPKSRQNNKPINKSSREKPPQKIPEPDSELYKKRLEYSRNYLKYINDCQTGKVQNDLFDTIPKKRPAPESTKKELPKKDTGEAIKKMFEKPKKEKTTRTPKLKGQGLLKGPNLWCAKCKKYHSQDYHTKKKPKPTPTPVKYEPRSKPIKQEDSYESEPEEYEEESDMSDFIEDDTNSENVSQMVRKMFNYDPSKYKHIDEMDDRDMEVGADRIFNEEKLSARYGKKDDQKEYKRLRKLGLL